LDVDGGAVSLGVDGERFVAIGDIDESARRVDLSGRFVVPAFIDSHVHLAYYAVAPELPAGGVAGVVDFAAPVATLAEPFPLFVRHSGPMITPLLGYPTQSWGSGGFGLEVASPEEAQSAVDRLLDEGASFIKTPLLGSSGVDDEMLAAIVEAAHARGARVAVHALAAADATRAIASSVDILAHTPTEALTEDVIAGWGDRAVVGTLSAFGSSAAALTNLKALADGGALVLYGTDLGNTREVGIQGAEIDALVRAGFAVSDIVHSATDRAATFWDLPELGRLEPGTRASFLVLTEDPQENPLSLTIPEAVVIDGRVVSGALP
jgi:imidazolonepropionase-like amidohydrolase